VIYTSSKWKTNAFSCTLKISTKTHSLLLAGDIEAIQEDELVNSIPEKLKADVLLAPHHGSATSSTSPFLRAVRPEFALFQVGYLNRYHHPKPEVMQRYLDFGIKPLRTDTSGAITLQFGSAITVNEYRKDHARYWYSR
jgi:competence protein ComEC